MPPEATAPAGWRRLKVVTLTTEVTTEPAGMFVPVTFMPASRPVVLVTVTAFAPATRVSPEPVAVAGLEMTSVVPFTTDVISAPAGMPVPVTSMPAESPAVLVTVTVGLPMVVEPAAKVVPATVAKAARDTVVPVGAWNRLSAPPLMVTFDVALNGCTVVEA